MIVSIDMDWGVGMQLWPSFVASDCGCLLAGEEVGVLEVKVVVT